MQEKSENECPAPVLIPSARAIVQSDPPVPKRDREEDMVIKKREKKEVPCFVCGRLSPESICLTCQARIQGEAIDKKQQREKKGRSDKERT